MDTMIFRIRQYAFLYFALKIVDRVSQEAYSGSMPETIAYEDLSEKVYQSIKGMILTGELLPGDKLKQEDLALRLGVSRTPLASAFSKLEKEMLVELLPRRGARVRALSKAELLDLYDVRIRLEPLGAAETAKRAGEAALAELEATLAAYRTTVSAKDPAAIRLADYQFHLVITRLSGNEALFRIVSSFNIVFICNQRGILKPPAKSLAEHEALAGAIRSHDAELASRIMEDHLLDARARLAALIEERP